MSSKEKIKIKKPIFSSDELTEVLIDKHFYMQSPPKLVFKKSVFVTYDGLVVKNFLLERSIAFNLKGFKDKNFYFSFWKEALEKYLVCKYGKSIPFVSLTNQYTYLLIHSKWFNYSFWINAYLPRLIQFFEENKDLNIKLIYPQNWGEISYVKESLNFFSIDYQIIPDDHQIFVPNLVYVELRDYTASFYPKSILDTSKFFKLHLSLKNQMTHRRVYLSRSQRGVRSVANELDVQKILIKYGFEIIIFENLTFIEQIKLMHQTKIFVSIHGAGFSNMMYMQSSSYVLELINRNYAKSEYTFPFLKLASVTNLNYSGILCPVVDQSKKLLGYGKNKDANENDFLVNQNIIVPIDELERIIQRITNTLNN